MRFYVLYVKTQANLLPLALGRSYCTVINGVSPVPEATKPSSGLLGTWGCLVAFLPSTLSPDSAPAVRSSGEKNIRRVKIIHWRLIV